MTGHRRTERSPYDSLVQPIVEEHPVDVLIHRRCPQKPLRRRIRRASEQLLSALGEKRRCWLLLEKLLNEYSANRERACFDLAHERGRWLGRTEALRSGASRKETGPLVERIWQILHEVDLSPAVRVAALIEAASGLTAGLEPGEPVDTVCLDREDRHARHWQR